MDPFRRQSSPITPFITRPWMNRNGAAAAATSGSVGLKGIIAGKTQ